LHFVEENHRVLEEIPRWDLVKLYAQWQKVHDTLEEKLHAVKCVSAVEQYQGMCLRCHEWFGWDGWQEGKKVMAYSGNYSKMDEWGKWKRVNNEEGRKNCRVLK